MTARNGTPQLDVKVGVASRAQQRCSATRTSVVIAETFTAAQHEDEALSMLFTALDLG